MSRQRRKTRAPEWARQEREGDLRWIGENMYLFWPAAKRQYQDLGRGAIVVDTQARSVMGAGNPFGYLQEAELDALGEADTIRMVREYDPEVEIVILLLKGEQSSVYRLMVLA